ncbi:uncharacterized protein LOC126897084 [Daktulosphaira vitifoliae]|uniref:uncharacterized protein LOC126897084 n=1 Tax=Daktulosphaira vitifoliae TaxID=58002 RepID=UPI0021AAE542|nr:uncharacterized protein LOC126897084 [Daktulosphaira vitifoliae]
MFSRSCIPVTKEADDIFNIQFLPTKIDKLVTCFLHIMIICLNSLLIKLSLNLYRNRLKFANYLDFIMYEVIHIVMEVVEITEHYCYMMIIHNVLILKISGEIILVFFLRLILNYLMKITTNSCAYKIFHLNLIFVVYQTSPVIITKLLNIFFKGSFSNMLCTQNFIKDNYTISTSKELIRENIYQGFTAFRKIMTLVISSYLSNRIMLILWSTDIMCTKNVFIRAKCSGHTKIQNTLKASTMEAIVTIIFLAVQLFFRDINKCFTTKYLVKTSIVMSFNMFAFRYAGAMMNPTYATAVMYGCKDMINKEHFIVYWLGPFIGAAVFKDIMKTVQFLYKIIMSQFGLSWKFPCPELTNNKNQRKESLNINDEQNYVSESLKKEIEQISLKEQEIDRVIENCNERCQGDLIMRGMEKLYVKKWEKARIEYFKIKHVSEEFELSRLIENTKRRMETEEMIDNESLSFLKHSIFELNEQLKYWKLKYDNDIVEINEKLNKLLQLLKTKKHEESLISFTFYKRQGIIDEYERIQIQLEQDRKNAEHKENMIIKIQAWWRGTMVRRRLGPYKQMLSLRKKSIKKMTSKGKNHKM